MKKVQATLQKLKMVHLSCYASILLVILGVLMWINWSRIEPTTTDRHQEVVNHFVTVSEFNQEKQVYYKGMRWILPDSTSRFFDIANYREFKPGISRDISRRLFYLESSDEFLDMTVVTQTDYAKKEEKTRKFWMAFVFSMMGLCLLCWGTFKSKHSGEVYSSVTNNLRHHLKPIRFSGWLFVCNFYKKNYSYDVDVRLYLFISMFLKDEKSY